MSRLQAVFDRTRAGNRAAFVAGAERLVQLAEVAQTHHRSDRSLK